MTHKKKTKLNRFITAFLKAAPVAVKAVGQPKGIRIATLINALKVFKDAWDETERIEDDTQNDK